MVPETAFNLPNTQLWDFHYTPNIYHMYMYHSSFKCQAQSSRKTYILINDELIFRTGITLSYYTCTKCMYFEVF